MVASHGLPLRDAPLAERLSDRCLESPGGRLNRYNAGTASETAECGERLWTVATVCCPDGRVFGTIGFCDEEADPQPPSAERERTFKLLGERIASHLGLDEVLGESLEHYRYAMELDPLARWTADSRGNLLDLNGRWQELTGGNRDQILGGAWRGHVHPHDRAAVLRAFSLSLRQGTPIDVRFRLRSGHGQWRWARTRARARRDPQGELLRWYGTTEDIHAQVAAEFALRESSAQLSTVINQAMVGILHRDLDGRVLTVNARYCEVVGRSPSELDGLPMEAFTHPDDVAWNARLFAQHAATGEPFQIEKRYLRPDGSSLWCAVHVSFVRDEQGAPRSTITVAQDIAARRQAECELQESRDLLQTVIDSVSDLIFVKDSDGRFVLANKAMREGCLELSPAVPAGFFDSDLYNAYRDADALVMQSGEPAAFDELIPFLGGLRTFETIKVPWRKGNDIAGVIGISRDIAERLDNAAALRESEEHYRFSVELNPQVPWTARPDGSVEELGPRWADFTGGDPAGARGDGWMEAVHPDDLAFVAERWRQAVRSQVPIDIEYRLQRSDRRYRWVRVRAAPRLDDAGNVIRWYGTLEDVDDHHRDQDALRKSEERFRLAAQAARLGIWDYDLDHGTREWSDELRCILGLPMSSEASPDVAFALVHPEDRPRTQAIAAAAMTRGGEQRFETVFRINRASDGQERWLCANGWRSEDSSGRLNRVLVAIRDITDARTADERIRWAARHDALTLLPNRSAFQDALDAAIEEASRLTGSMGLLLIDVDHLKQTNDCFGHDAGDALLRTIATRLAAIAGNRAFTARLGGDEFALLFSGRSAQQDMSVAIRKLGQVLGEAFVHEGRILDCRATSGGSVFPKDGASGADLLKAADLALYSAKAKARGELMMFRPEMRADLERRSAMINIAREAIDDERVTPFYQPKIELSSGKLIGFEALLRWHHPANGLRLPGEISAAFDDLDLALALSDRMFDQTILHMRRWLDDGLEFGTIAINAASAEFRRDDLAERVLERLERAGVAAARLELEVTETVFLGSGSDHVDRALRLLSAAGVRIALDDFGTGYASLSHLKQYPVDTIKIDRSFVCDLESEVGDVAIVNAVINLGKSLGMGIVAEGIETDAQASHLLGQGCTFGQGYLFGRASAPDTIASLVSGWTPRHIQLPTQTE